MSGVPERARGIYLFPNLLTTAGLFAAFYAIVAAVKGHYDSAAMSIFVAMLMDALDGRVARLTNTESDFGVEYDSLADMVSFGVAPSLVIYIYALQNLGKLGWLVAFIYTASVALRLARFNTQYGVANKNYFQGLPSPPAAAVVASLVWVSEMYTIPTMPLFIIMATVTLIVSALMVSNIRYNSFKEMDLKGRVPFIALVVIVLGFVLVSLKPPVVFLCAFSIYAISGPVLTLLRLRSKRLLRKRVKRRKASG